MEGQDSGGLNLKNRINMELKINVVTVDEEDSVTWIGFADDEYDTKDYVLLSYNRQEPEEGLYIEMNDQKWSGYGLIDRIQLLESSVVIGLTENGAKELDTNSGIKISILPNTPNWPALKTRIRALLLEWVPDNL